MKRFYKYSIENKMLLSFLSLFILAMLLVGAFSYWSTYQLYKETKLIQLEEKMSYLHGFYEHLLDLEESQQISTQEAEQHYLKMAQEVFLDGGIKIVTDDGGILFAQENTITPEATFSQEITREQSLVWGWLVQSSVTLNPLSPFFVDIQKYTIILVIMTSIIVIQIIIGLSHHFAQPLQDLVEAVEKIDVNTFPDVQLSDRKDEIGILYNAFSRMLLRLKKSR